MSELKAIRGGDIHDLVKFGDGSEIYHEDTLYYLKNAVDTVIEEKDRVIEFVKTLTLKDIEIIKEKDKDIEELKSENRKLKRALWLARVLRARDIQRWWIAATCAPITERACSVWNNVERKCRAMAEEYK